MLVYVEEKLVNLLMGQVCLIISMIIYFFTVENYDYLINGDEAVRVQAFSEVESTFEQKCNYVVKLQKVKAEINSMSTVEYFEMVSFICSLKLLVVFTCRLSK